MNAFEKKDVTVLEEVLSPEFVFRNYELKRSGEEKSFHKSLVPCVWYF